jgi:hypothetical protein
MECTWFNIRYLDCPIPVLIFRCPILFTVPVIEVAHDRHSTCPWCPFAKASLIFSSIETVVAIAVCKMSERAFIFDDLVKLFTIFLLQKVEVLFEWL